MKENLADWHTHNSLCRHASGNLEDYVQAAIKKGLKTIGFSDHFPYEFYDLGDIPHEEYGMKLSELDNYISTAKKLLKQYYHEINIKIGFELDYMEANESLLNKYILPYKKEVDYLLGSIHILEPPQGKWCLDDTRYLKQYEIIGVDEVYIQYFNKMKNMLNSKGFDFDIISHFDLPKKFNKRPVNKEKIKEKATELLELIKEKDKVVEINSGGMRKDVKEQYPSQEIIKIMHELDIPILFGSDSHDPNELGYKFDELSNLVKKIGYNHLTYFDKRKRSFKEI